MAQLSSKLNPSALEFLPASSCRLSASASEFVPSYRCASPSTSEFVPSPIGLPSLALEFPASSHRLSASAPEFIPSRHLSPPITYGKSIYQGFATPFTAIPAEEEEEERIRCTIFVTEIDTRITEMELAHVFEQFGLVYDCRICGDTRKGRRFGFVEFENEYCAAQAQRLNGTIIGSNSVPIKVKASLSSIVPVKLHFLPRTEEEQYLVLKTVYCRNIDHALSEEEVRGFFNESVGEVSKIRLIGDPTNKTLNAFVEFVNEDHARTALGLSGTRLGNLNIRVTCSKTPIRPPRV